MRCALWLHSENRRSTNVFRSTDPTESDGEGEEVDERVEGCLAELNTATTALNEAEKSLEVLCCVLLC